MGDPKKRRKKYSTPTHPWQKERLDIETEYTKKYGLRNKKEIYRVESMLRRYKSNLKRLLRMEDCPQKTKEHNQIILKLKSLNLIKDDTQSEDNILGLKADDLFNRRLQTIVYKKGLAGSINQARQFIVHQHITINGKKVTSPGYFVNVQQEPSVGFAGTSSLSKEDHPEILASRKNIKKEIEMTKPKTDEKRLLDEDILPEEATDVEKEIEIELEEQEPIEIDSQPQIIEEKKEGEKNDE